MAAGTSNMTNEEVKLHLRELYNRLFGPGYFDTNTENVYVYTWFFGSPNAVYIDIMSKHGGDQALESLAQGRGYGTWH